MPSFNQTDFLTAALDSVLSYQGDLELIVMDGGSTDGSVELLERYGPRLTYWHSAPDAGQAAAINAGFERARGEIFCWLNSDDMYVPGALTRVVAAAGESPRRFFRYGSSIHLREQPVVEVALAPAHADVEDRILHEAIVVQPSAFWSRDVWESTGPLDESLHFAFDWEWFIRARANADFQWVDEVYSIYRLHEAHKTGTGGAARRADVREVVRRHAPEQWRHLYDQLFDMVEREAPRIATLQRRGLSFHRAGLLTAARHGMVPMSMSEARRWSFVLRMYA
jgi:glycosyltransferase involved in cell wall biosynthesis